MRMLCAVLKHVATCESDWHCDLCAVMRKMCHSETCFRLTLSYRGQTTICLFNCSSLVLPLVSLYKLFVCLLNRSLREETHLGSDGTRIEKKCSSQAKKPI